MPTTCAAEGDCFVFEYLGYVTDVSSGQTIVTFRVTNKCKYATGYVAIATGAFTRISPANDSRYTGSLGIYDVSWTRATGKPGFVSIKFETRFDSFSNGASDVFSIVVGNFDPNTTIQVQGRAGFNEETFSFLLSQTTCSPLSVPRSFRWLTESGNGWSWWPGLPQSTIFQTQGNADIFRFPNGSEYWPLPAAEVTAAWKRLAIDASAADESSAGRR
jgi:hypothetical protein